MPRTKKKSAAQRNAQRRKHMRMRRTGKTIVNCFDFKDDQCSSRMEEGPTGPLPSSRMEEEPTKPCLSSRMEEGPTEPCLSFRMEEGPTEPCLSSRMEEGPTENAVDPFSEPCTEPYTEHCTESFTEIHTGNCTEKYSENLSKSVPLNQMQFDPYEEEIFIAVPIDIANKNYSSNHFLGNGNFKTESLVFGSFHQGDQRFGIESRGNQCVANSLCALFYGSCLGRLLSQDLDKVLVTGDQLYITTIAGLKAKFQYSSKLLSFDDVPSFLDILDRKYQIVKSDVISGVAIDIFGDTQLPSLHQALDLAFQSASCNLVLIGAICSAVYLRDGLYYIFDSHSHDYNGLSTVDGFSMLASFKSMEDLVGFMYTMYNSMLIDLTSQYEVLPLVFTHSDNTIIQQPDNLVTAETFQAGSHNLRKTVSQCKWTTVARGKNKAKNHSQYTKKIVEDKCHVEPKVKKRAKGYTIISTDTEDVTLIGKYFQDQMQKNKSKQKYSKHVESRKTYQKLYKQKQRLSLAYKEKEKETKRQNLQTKERVLEERKFTLKGYALKYAQGAIS